MMDKLIAGQLLSILVADLGYRERPLHGHNPIRHQLAWSLCESVLCDDFSKELSDICEQVDDENNKD